MIAWTINVYRTCLWLSVAALLANLRLGYLVRFVLRS